VVPVDLGEKLLVALALVFTVAYIVSWALRDYWSALSSAICMLVVAIIVVERRCRRWCKHESTQVD
jgi:Flp pilus assembly protein TadB